MAGILDGKLPSAIGKWGMNVYHNGKKLDNNVTGDEANPQSWTQL